MKNGIVSKECFLDFILLLKSKIQRFQKNKYKFELERVDGLSFDWILELIFFEFSY